MPDAGTLKQEQRRTLRARRASMGADARQIEAAKISAAVLDWAAAHLQAPGAVAAYWPAGTEPPITGLLAQLHEAEHRLYLPVCEPGFRLSWVQWTPETVFGDGTLARVSEPEGVRHGPEVMADVDLLLVPALAADQAGNRMGQGGGYYDRFLAGLSGRPERPVTAVVVFEAELVPVDDFEHSALDIPVDGVFTAAGWHEAYREKV